MVEIKFVQDPQERILGTGVFERAQLFAQTDSTKPLATLVLNLAEKKRGWYGAGAGYTSSDRLRFSAEWGLRNLTGMGRQVDVSGNLYYAPVRPDADIVGLLGPHFAERFPDQALIVHDIRRGTAFWSDRGASGIVDLTGLPDEIAERLSRDCDPQIERLWRTYFTRIANPERRNPRLQRRLMPARYWDLLVERPGSPVDSLRTR